MRHPPIHPELLIANRQRLTALMLPNSLAVVNANDVLPTNADGTFLLHQNADLFYLTGVRQEETVLLLYPDAHDEKLREILFVKEPSELLTLWEGAKLTKEQARMQTGVRRVEWLSEFRGIFHRLMCECDHVYLNSNEHKRAVIEVETREARFVRETRARYPLHQYHRLARLLHRLRAVKSPAELELIRQGCALTRRGFLRVLRTLRPGLLENEVEAEFAYEFIRGGGAFAYPPIIASGASACVLHYVQNDAVCRSGDLLLMDVASSYGSYNADMTRTVPVNGRFTRRQKAVYRAVLQMVRQAAQLLRPGLLIRDWQKSTEQMAEEACLQLGLLKRADLKRQDPDQPALKRYLMHGVGHPLGLDVHDVGLTTEPIQAGWVMTCEPALYLRQEGFGIRLEDDILVTDHGPVNLMADIPIEPEEIEELMAKGQGRGRRRRRRG
ncbi:MAG TPA: Xaa-Pro aminopeptidase [Verrucomicrobiae bacterium]|nr:Xaa-Pro aminopeptidase [Verrucomicrobiae bacterium]